MNHAIESQGGSSSAPRIFSSLQKQRRQVHGHVAVAEVYVKPAEKDERKEAA